VKRVLVVDDDPGMRECLGILFSREGYEVEETDGVTCAETALSGRQFDLVITDLRMNGEEQAGLEVLRLVKRSQPDCPALVLTAYGTVGSAVEAVRLGAYDYIQKPFENEELFLVAKRALDETRLRRENLQLKEELVRTRRNFQLIGQSPAMEKVKRQVERVAPLDTTVLILGESGTGKDLVASAIHMQSDRRNGPFIPVNCGGIPETLLESELFGHVRGAFTGASSNRQGLFEAADGGTLFLDEISETPSSFQVKLLRAIEEQSIKRVGSSSSKPVNVRILSASNRDLRALAESGGFREDLFFRLNVVALELPALREREGDLEILVRHFLSGFAVQGKPKELTEQAMCLLRSYSWPGNVRELKHCLENAVIMTEGDLVDEQHLPKVLREVATEGTGVIRCEVEGHDGEGVDLDSMLDDLEKRMIEQALDRTKQVQVEAARFLKITPRSLRYRMKKHGMRG